MTEANLSTNAQRRLGAIETDPAAFETGYRLGKNAVLMGMKSIDVLSAHHNLDGSLWEGLVLGAHLHEAARNFMRETSKARELKNV